ncbi:uncharacterized protein V6R79_025133 [Siganus canaliculatus]
MALTQDAVLSLLIKKGGKMKKSRLVSKFKDSVDCDDPAEKQRQRELFKTFVNNVAFVKEIDGVRYVMVKKNYQHLLDSAQSAETAGNKHIPETGEQQRPPTPDQNTESCDDAGSHRSAVPGPEHEQPNGDNSENPMEELSLVQQALRRSRLSDVKLKRSLNFGIQRQDTSSNDNSNASGNIPSKPFALPLRIPASASRMEIHKLKADPDDHPESPTQDSSRSMRRPHPVEIGGTISSPQLRRAAKNTKTSEEPRGETRVSSVVPLDPMEHEWLVKCASGQWSQVHGLLLNDNYLAEKRDFMSGFTVLHWAAKCGNKDMLVTVIDVSKQGGVDIDINAKTHGGYTPLHIAALHNQPYIMAMLVTEYGANPDIRDNCGKKPYQYLHKGMSGTVREILCKPKPQQAPERFHTEKEELDLFPDLSKGLHSISRLFQPHMTGHKKKPKHRPGLFSMSEDPCEEQEDGGSSFRQRTLSDVFM